ncbi:MAG: hypothetical protein M3387_04085 [Actinomycetota bacterium]|nr:hypothetical protein [Actinomycetota bacterium]
MARLLTIGHGTMEQPDLAGLLHGTEVVHLLQNGRLTPHGPTDGVRRDGDRLVYDVDDRVSQPSLSLGVTLG